MEAMPSQNTRPLPAIVRQVELREHGRITEIEYDHGVWEVKLRQAMRPQKLWFDPITAERLRQAAGGGGGAPPPA